VNLGNSKAALATLESMLFRAPSSSNNTTLLHNVLDWMGEPALPLVKQYIDRGGNRQGKYGIGILGRIAQLNGW
ncbi:MAG: sulfatase, partial [Rubripirellula sp.]|nr:sulfatase [Rubripirellula sp.]